MTIIQWFRQIEDEQVKQRALSAMTASKADQEVGSLADAISEGISWGEEGSHHGWMFWFKQWEKAKAQGKIGPPPVVNAVITQEVFDDLLAAIDRGDSSNPDYAKFIGISLNVKVQGQRGYLFTDPYLAARYISGEVTEKQLSTMTGVSVMV